MKSPHFLKISILSVITISLFYILSNAKNFENEITTLNRNYRILNQNLARVYSSANFTIHNVVIINSCAKDEPKSRVQCENHPGAVFCTDSELGIPCAQIVTSLKYTYSHLTYKKLVCFRAIRNIYEDKQINILTIDTDVYFPDEIVYKILPKKELQCTAYYLSIYYKADRYMHYTFRRFQKNLCENNGCCIGAFIYVTNEQLRVLSENFEFFEHYKTDDLSFTIFYRRLGVPVAALQNEDALPLGLCRSLPILKLNIRIQCSAAELKNEYKLMCPEK